MQKLNVFSVPLTKEIISSKLLIIKEMVATGKSNTNNSDQLVADIMAHELEMETDVLPDVALPHAKSSAVDSPFIVVTKWPDGVKWNNDNKVKLIILIAAGKDASKEHLAIIAKLASNLADDDFNEDLLNSDVNQIADKIRALYE